MPIKLGIDLETSKSGDVDTDELNLIVGDHILAYLQQMLLDYQVVSIEIEMSLLSEPVRRLQAQEAGPMILRLLGTGFVYFLGGNLPTTEYLNEILESAFYGDETEKVLDMFEASEDPVLRSSTAVGPDIADSKEEYIAIVENSTSSFGDVIMDNIVYISAGLASGVVLIALLAAIQYRRAKNVSWFLRSRYFFCSKNLTCLTLFIQDRDDLSLTEIPWLSVQVPKRASKINKSESSMKAPTKAGVKEISSVLTSIGGHKAEKVALREDTLVSPESKTYLAADDKTTILTQLYERSLLEDDMFEKKAVPFDNVISDVCDVISCDALGTRHNAPIATRDSEPQTTTTTPPTLGDKEVDVNHVILEEKSRKSMRAFTIKKKITLHKKVSLPSMKRTLFLNKIKNKSKRRGGEPSQARENTSIPLTHLATDRDSIPDILTAISHESGIKEAWDQISRKYKMDPNWDTNISVSSKDLENTSFQCGGSSHVKTTSESHILNEGSDSDVESNEMSDASDYTESDSMSNLSFDSYSYGSGSSISD